MNVHLLTAPTATEFTNRTDLLSEAVLQTVYHPNLGVLSLAAVLEGRGYIPKVTSLNQFFHSYVERGGSSFPEFEQLAIRHIAASESDVFGFSTICSSYPLTLRLAKGVKALRPDSTIVLGGPQASVVDRETLTAFPFVDFILRGEAERSLPNFLEELSDHRDFSSVPGLTYRAPFGPVRNGNPPVIEDLESLPLPAYHLTGELDRLDWASLDAGRGCPFACTFCSTNDFFRRRFRLKSPARLLEEMHALEAKYGIRKFDLVHDMFTVDRKRVTAFCEALLADGGGYQWICSARTDCIDEALVDLMVAAGCIGLFFGIESGSARIQRIMDKNLDPKRALEMVAYADRKGIKTTVSLIMGFPEETWEDIGESVAFYMHSLRCAKSSPQLNLLAPLAETPLYTRHQDELTLTELCSDMSHQGRGQDEADLEMIRRYPRIFPNFYVIRTPFLDRDCLTELREFFIMAGEHLGWLMVALHRAQPNLVNLFFRWREHRISIHAGLQGTAVREYYLGEDSRKDFIGFMSLIAGEYADRGVAAMLEYYENSLSAEKLQPPRCWRAYHSIPVSQWRSDDIPARRGGAIVIEAKWDLPKVIASLRGGEEPEFEGVARYYFRQPVSDALARVAGISPLAAAALLLCDGDSNLEQFMYTLSDRFPTLDAPGDRRLASLELLKGLYAKGYVEMFRIAPAAEASHEGGEFIREYRDPRVVASAQNTLLSQEA